MRAWLRFLPLLLLGGGVAVLFARDAAKQLSPARAPAPAADADRVPRLVVIGVDGLDHRLLARYLAGDALPNLGALAKDGTFLPLEPELPPESPTSWASLLTGRAPGHHGILDFIVPTADYDPENGMVSVQRARLAFGKVPIRPPRLRSRLALPTFIQRVHDAGYRTLSLRQPLLFPAPDKPGTRWWSGLGTPDLAGSAGTYAVYSDAVGFTKASTTFGGVQLPLTPEPDGRTHRTELLGPVDPAAGRDARGRFQRASLPLVLERLDGADGPEGVRIQLAGQTADVAVGGRSPFLDAVFRTSTIPSVSVPGIVRFTVRSLDPLVVLASPINADPRDPPFPITSPGGYSEALARRHGLFETVGWLEETFPLNDRHQDDAGFLADVLEDTERATAILLGELSDDDDLVFCNLTGVDRACHAFWRYRDAAHPGADTRDDELGDPILRVLAAVDRAIGAVRARLRPEDVLLVVSDHGFQTWRFGVNVNQWLLDHGYLVLSEDAEHKTLEHVFAGLAGSSAVDWSRTRAFAIGLGQVYINRTDRFAQGIVAPEDADALAAEIREGLLAMRNPYADTAPGAGLEAAPLRRVVQLKQVWSGRFVEDAAELQLCFDRGYRVSWQTALLGGMRKGGPVFEENRVPWSGDHCSTDPALVPGVLLSNRAIPPAPRGAWHVRDIAATVLEHFGLDLAPLAGEARPIPIGAR